MAALSPLGAVLAGLESEIDSMEKAWASRWIPTNIGINFRYPLSSQLEEQTKSVYQRLVGWQSDDSKNRIKNLLGRIEQLNDKIPLLKVQEDLILCLQKCKEDVRRVNESVGNAIQAGKALNEAVGGVGVEHRISEGPLPRILAEVVDFHQRFCALERAASDVRISDFKLSCGPAEVEEESAEENSFVEQIQTASGAEMLWGLLEERGSEFNPESVAIFIYEIAKRYMRKDRGFDDVPFKDPRFEIIRARLVDKASSPTISSLGYEEAEVRMPIWKKFSPGDVARIAYAYGVVYASERGLFHEVGEGASFTPCPWYRDGVIDAIIDDYVMHGEKKQFCSLEDLSLFAMALCWVKDRHYETMVVKEGDVEDSVETLKISNKNEGRAFHCILADIHRNLGACKHELTKEVAERFLQAFEIGGFIEILKSYPTVYEALRATQEDGST